MMTETPETVYFEVTLTRSVEVRGHVYRPPRPSERLVVDQAVLDAMGDAVATQRPVQG